MGNGLLANVCFYNNKNNNMDKQGKQARKTACMAMKRKCKNKRVFAGPCWARDMIPWPECTVLPCKSAGDTCASV
jgi:hypothetical protein